MSDVWNLFDDDSPEERLQIQRTAEISAAESKALALIRQIGAAADDHPDVSNAASAALTHLATIAQAAGQALFRRTIDRDQQRRQDRRTKEKA